MNIAKAIKDKINGNTPLASVHAKVFFDQVAEGVAKPYVRTSMVAGTTMLGFNDVLIDDLQIQLSVFDTTLGSAITLRDALQDAFHGKVLTLDNGLNVLSVKRSSGLRREAKAKDGSEIYHAWLTVQFLVQK